MNIEKLKEKYYITTCGRVFIKDCRYLSIGSLSENPTETGTFLRFIRRNNLSADDFIRKDTGCRNKSNKKLYTYEYIHEQKPIYYEISQFPDKNKYMIVSTNQGLMKVHRLVMLFHSYSVNHNILQVNHIDGNKKNNSINNLEWCTPKQNINHAWKNNLSKRTEEQNNKLSKTLLEQNDISYIFKSDCRKVKRDLLGLLKRRGYDCDMYEFVKMDKDSTNHGLGYLKLK